jgi:hypothetical protein
VRLLIVPLLLVTACAGAANRTPSPPDRVELGPVPVPEAASASTLAPPPASSADTAPPAKPDLPHFDIRNASTTYDFSLSLDEDCSSDKAPMGVCDAPGNLVVFRKGSDAPLQRVPLESIDVVIADNGEPLVNASPMYDYQGTIEVGDFDFDGHEDFAVQDSEQGPYGGPTFQVFLYQPRTRQFVMADELTDLTHTTLGFFQVDPVRKRITTFAKSGCCYHVTEEYRVVRGAPVMVSRFTEDATGEGDVLETTEGLRGGKWVTSTKRVPR